MLSALASDIPKCFTLPWCALTQDPGRALCRFRRSCPYLNLSPTMEGLGPAGWLHRAPVFPNISPDPKGVPCRTRQYSFQSRQSSLAQSAGILARSEWWMNQKSVTLLDGGVCHAEAFSGSGSPGPQVEGARRLGSRSPAQGWPSPRFVRSDPCSGLYRRTLRALARDRGGEFRSAHWYQTGHRVEDRGLASDSYRRALDAESGHGHRAFGSL